MTKSMVGWVLRTHLFTEMAKTKDKKQPEHVVSTSLLKAACQVARSAKAGAIFAYLEAIPDTECLKNLALNSTELILVVRDETGEKLATNLQRRSITVPDVTLTRMGQIKTAALIAFSQRLLNAGECVVFLVGPAEEAVDSMVVMRVGEEWEMFQTIDQPKLTEHVKRVVFERALRIALELASEGREGKAVGALFVIGDSRAVAEYCQQMILNPFKGYTESERNILDENVRETVKGFATLDGAFVIKGNGVIVSAGTHLKGLKSGEPLPQGLGARHAAAAGITASTKTIAITISQSTGTVRVWRLGQMITEIEKAPPPTRHAPLDTAE